MGPDALLFVSIYGFWVKLMDGDFLLIWGEKKKNENICKKNVHSVSSRTTMDPGAAAHCDQTMGDI